MLPPQQEFGWRRAASIACAEQLTVFVDLQKTNMPCQVSPWLCAILWLCALCNGICRRPIADFLVGKQQTADLFADAVCRAGWCLNNAAAQAVVLSHVLPVCGAPKSSFQAYMWASASILAQPEASWKRCDKGAVDPASVSELAVSALALRLSDDAVAGSAPAFAEYIIT